YYDRIKPRLHQRIGRELRVAYRVVDFGCGSCTLVQFLRDNYRQRVTGIDISDNDFPQHSRKRSRRRSRKCVKADAGNIGFIRDETIDAVVSMWALHEMEEPGRVLREAYRVLRPGGEILIVEFPRDSIAQQLWNEQYYSVKEIGDMLNQPGFIDVKAKTIERRQIIWATAFRPSRKKEH
ncbi:MAG: class I SAM-dependent methyltransferase, partial [Candidatus Hydrogenedentes bacterium]|nr:class I SAM-dependent methyltransferase [Candidatus Hydrogenedentota bacterium]